MLMEMFMKESGKMIKLMDKANIPMYLFIINYYSF